MHRLWYQTWFKRNGLVSKRSLVYDPGINKLSLNTKSVGLQKKWFIAVSTSLSLVQ